MIVKNEEETLERCLRSVAGIPDEIIIIDTGSEDNTKEIARNFTPQIFDFEWVDDFSAARNYSFEQATMDYILWLDADDVLHPEERTKLLELKNTLAPQVDAVSMVYHTAFDSDNNVTQSNRRLRLVRRSKNFRWSGVVHEDLASDSTFHYLDSDIVVTHLKPPSEHGPSTRNLQLYKRHLEQGRSLRPADLFHYAQELRAHGEFEEAITYYLQFLESKNINVDASLLALHELAKCYHLTGNLEKEWECTLRSLEFDVPRPEFSCRFAERFLQNNQFRQAIFWYELALRDQAGVSARAIENYPFKTWLPHKQLGLCYYRIKDYERSLHHNKLARQYLPHDQDIETNIRLLEGLVNGPTGQGQAAEG
jgi:glycosyltransferase involved in cell wall biosynthesis